MEHSRWPEYMNSGEFAIVPRYNILPLKYVCFYTHLSTKSILKTECDHFESFTNAIFIPFDSGGRRKQIKHEINSACPNLADPLGRPGQRLRFPQFDC